MMLPSQDSGCCFAWGCFVRMFDIYDKSSMDQQLAYQAEKMPGGGYGPGLGHSPPRRYYYDSVSNRLFCPEHGSELLRLRTDLPLAIQELDALSRLRGLAPVSQLQDAVGRVRQLRELESRLLPYEREAEPSAGEQQHGSE